MVLNLSKRALKGAALATAVLLTGGGYALASTSTDQVRATCTPNPLVSGKTVVAFDVHCSVPIPTATSTVTVTASPTASASPTTTTSASATTTSATATPTTSTTTTSASSGGQPTEANVGTTGTLTKQDGGTLPSGTYENVEFTSEVRIYDSNVTLRNVKAPAITIYGPGGYTLDRVEADGGIYVDAYYNPINGVTMSGVRIRAGAQDGIDIFSGNHQISNVSIDGAILDGFTFPSSSADHGDGIQVRGVTNFTLRNALIDMGAYQPQKNAALYMEDVADGLRNVLIEDVWLRGGGYTFYTATASTASTARNVAIEVSGNWGPVMVTGTKANWTFDNVTGPDGSQLTP